MVCLTADLKPGRTGLSPGDYTVRLHERPARGDVVLTWDETQVSWAQAVTEARSQLDSLDIEN